eukprot:CAMPEP_0178960686 /NCGR_PEP_ID=MMETSP0789-20121207/13118_1 /TAXON_ID=3005 /ORGANISM="Rhizosolenia setigera, Strain CCMP 1694" /LENGTH=467 /DNA_ID=CAMNT_0020644095 /DNA_START=73 /DNA_END=1476 /DNA_ORIENTATION=+
MTQSRSIRIIFCTSMLSVLLSSTSMSSSAFMTTPSSLSFQRNGILHYNNLNNEKFTLYAESNNHNHYNDENDKKRSFTFFNSRKTQKLIKKSTKLILPALFFTLSPQTTTLIQPANAVLGKIPTRPKSSRPDADELAKERIRGQQNMPQKPDFNDPKYQGEAGEKLKTLHMRMYQEQLNKYNEANNGEGSRISGLSQGGPKVDAIRPTAPLRPQTASSTASSIGEAEAINDVEGQESSTDESSSTTNSESAAAAAQLQMLRQQQALASSSSSSTSSSSSSSSISVQSVRKPASQKKISTTKQRTKQITSRLIKLSGFAAAGIAYGRFQNGRERRKVQKGIEIYNTQKAEFFNVTLDPDSDLSVDEQIKRARSNSTDTDDDDDYDMDDDPDEDDEPPTGRSNRGVSGGGKPPKKPSSGGSGSGSGSTGGSSSSSPSSPSTSSSSSSSDEYKKASDDDIERMKRLFDKD